MSSAIRWMLVACLGSGCTAGSADPDKTDVCKDCVDVTVVARSNPGGDLCAYDSGHTGCESGLEVLTFTEWTPLQDAADQIPLHLESHPDLQDKLDLADQTALVAWDEDNEGGYQLDPTQAVLRDGIIEVEWEKSPPHGPNFDAPGRAWVIATVEGHNHTFSHHLTEVLPKD